MYTVFSNYNHEIRIRDQKLETLSAYILSHKLRKGLDTVESLSAGAMWDPKFLP